MKKYKILKIVGIIVLSLIFVVAIGIGYIYYNFYGKFNINEEKYPYTIGHIYTEDILKNNSFELCKDVGVIGTYCSAAPKIYKNSKYSFKQKINSNYTNKGYLDTGYLNLRFHINCKGEVGDMEVNELNLEFEKIDLSDGMVEQLITLTHSTDNWNLFYENANYYMYFIYKIENGEVVEILP